MRRRARSADRTRPRHRPLRTRLPGCHRQPAPPCRDESPGAHQAPTEVRSHQARARRPPASGARRVGCRASSRSPADRCRRPTLSMVPRPAKPLTTVRRRLPMPTGPSVRSSPRIAYFDHWGDRVGSLRTAKTSSIGRSIVTLQMNWPMTGTSLTYGATSKASPAAILISGHAPVRQTGP